MPSGLGLGGLPRFFLGGGSSPSTSGSFFSLGGLPRFLPVTGADVDAAGAAVASFGLFLEPLGRPRPRLTGGAFSGGAALDAAAALLSAAAGDSSS